MLKTICLSLLVVVQGAFGHGGHENSGPAAGETIQQYAQRHVCFHITFHTTKLIIASIIDVVGAPYVSIDAHLFLSLAKPFVRQRFIRHWEFLPPSRPRQVSSSP